MRFGTRYDLISQDEDTRRENLLSMLDTLQDWQREMIEALGDDPEPGEFFLRFGRTMLEGVRDIESAVAAWRQRWDIDPQEPVTDDRKREPTPDYYQAQATGRAAEWEVTGPNPDNLRGRERVSTFKGKTAQDKARVLAAQLSRAYAAGLKQATPITRGKVFPNLEPEGKPAVRCTGCHTAMLAVSGPTGPGIVLGGASADAIREACAHRGGWSKSEDGEYRRNGSK